MEQWWLCCWPFYLWCLLFIEWERRMKEVTRWTNRSTQTIHTWRPLTRNSMHDSLTLLNFISKYLRIGVIFTSTEPKAQGSFSDQNLSIVCGHHCCKLFAFLSSSSPKPLGQFKYHCLWKEGGATIPHFLHRNIKNPNLYWGVNVKKCAKIKKKQNSAKLYRYFRIWVIKLKAVWIRVM